MTVSELIEQLSYMNKDAEVHFAYGSGDHWRTVVSEEVTEADIGYVKYSDYHRKFKVVDRDDDDEEHDDRADLVEVVIIQ